ncbi:adipokinetic prohormone type 3-like [Vespula squamosa]|uniref:Adipokinetic prohormone type 3-like n=1 Tax=Vespula squamosa TaxID=30214 RepID=A0ABD2ACY5_VESSQ
MFDSVTKEAVPLNNIEKVSTRIRNNRSNVVTAILLVSLIFLTYLHEAKGQVNFSTGWGKRSQNIPTSNTNNPRCLPQQGRPSLEQLLNLYNFIQIEAQKIVDRQKLNK